MQESTNSTTTSPPTPSAIPTAETRTLTVPLGTSPRQAIRFTSINDVIKTAEVLHLGGCQPKNVDRASKLVPMLIAGAELGLGIMQSLQSITPPINGACKLYGDAGLALIRASGLLQKLEEHVEGEGDDRKAVCTIQRHGYPVRRFEYSIKLAKKLTSYKSAHSINPKTKEPMGGPWADDTDNMLQVRANWRGYRKEFTDVLAGMTGAEEDEIINVEATVIPQIATTTPPATTTTQPIQETVTPSGEVIVTSTATTTAEPLMVTDQQLTEIQRLRVLMITSLGSGVTDDIIRANWLKRLSPFGTESARQMTFDAAAKFIEALGAEQDTFTYGVKTPPTTSTTGTQQSDQK